jgi:predicted dehydrogenase
MTILIIGGGKMGMSHLSLLTQYIGKSNVVLCDSNFLTRIIFSLLGYKTFGSLDLVLNSGSVKGAIIATPTSSHFDIARSVIRNRIPLFIEKPLTLNVNNSYELIQMANAYSVSVQLGFVMRYVNSFQNLKDLVSDGSLGCLYGYSASMSGCTITKPLASKSWQGDFSRGGGCLNEYGPHLIDLCRFIFGPISSISNARMTSIYSIRADDSIDVSWIHNSSTPGTIKINWCDSTKRKSVIEFNVNFEKANVRVDNSTIDIHWHHQIPSSIKNNYCNISANPKNVVFYLRGEEFSLEIEDFLGQCFGHNFHTPEFTDCDMTPRLVDGYEVDKLIDAIAYKVGLK